MKILLMTLNAKYIHKNLALRWIYQACPYKEDVILKEYTIKENLDHIVQEVEVLKPDVLAFSTYIWNIEFFQKLLVLLKDRLPALHILAGGPEVSFASTYLLDQGVDALSIGEGEQSVWEYVDMLKSGQTYEITGICTRDFPNSEYRKVSLDYLESLPDPYFMEMDRQNMDKQYLYFETSRGCPYHCAYCLSSTDTCVRMFSEDYIFRILQHISTSSVKQVKLLDRTFNANPQRALRIARYMNTYCKQQIFQFEVVAETLSQPLLEFFCKEADKTRFRLEIGVQSFHAETLKAVGRIQNNERLKEVIFALRDAGVMMHVDLIAGLPYEDFATFGTSFDTLFAYEVKEIQLGILKLLKGTRLRTQKEEYAYEIEGTAPYTVQKTRWLSEEELILMEGAAAACEKFYNSGKCRGILQGILRAGWFESPFTCFVELGKLYRELKHPYPVQELYRTFLKLLPDVDQWKLKGLIAMDYYKQFVRRPPRLWKDGVTSDQRKAVFECALQQQISAQTLFHYGQVELAYWNESCGYQIILYHPDQQPVTRFFIDEQYTYIKEITL